MKRQIIKEVRETGNRLMKSAILLFSHVFEITKNDRFFKRIICIIYNHF